MGNIGSYKANYRYTLSLVTNMRTLLLIASLMILGGSGCKPAASTGKASTSTATKEMKAERVVYDRNELKRLIEGKTVSQVIDLLGKPDDTTESGSEMDARYKRISRDPVTGKIDDSAFIHFRDGVATHAFF